MTQYLTVGNRQIPTTEFVKMNNDEKELLLGKDKAKDEPKEDVKPMTRQELIKAYKDKFWESPDLKMKNVELLEAIKE